MRQKPAFTVTAVIMALAACLATTSCRTPATPEFAKAGIVNSPARDTLFVNLKDFDDEWVNIYIRSNDVNYKGREQVVNGKAWFNIGHLPTGYYTVWIEFGPYYFSQHFWHTVTY